MDPIGSDPTNSPDVPPLPPFGDLLRRYRRRAGLSQERLAERAEVSPRELSYLENGNHHPHPGTALRLANSLGLAGEERTVFLRAAEADDTPVRPAASAALPAEPTPFIGRKREVDVVLDLLSQSEVRLLTLIGPGGIGKTRLALQAGSKVAGRFGDGITFVPLAAVRSSDLVANAIVGALALPDTASRRSMEALTEYLREQEVLLILDNFEHLLEGGQVVANLLAACRRVKALVTSRAVLRLAAEHVFEVPPLASPAPDRLPDMEELAQYDAIALFVARARARMADFVLVPENAGAVAAICRRLDGLPLAIELAAARVPIFSPPVLLSRLSRRLPLLTGGARDMPERQWTLRGTIDWSYQLLTAPEQMLFTRLSVFEGGCTLEAVEAICLQDDGARDVLEGMTSLVDKSLVHRVESRAEEPRFGMLETIREYAGELLSAAGEEDTVRRRHAEYFARFADRLESAFTGECFVRSTDRLESEFAQLDRRLLAARLAALDEERDNLWSALTWTVARGEAALGLRLAPVLVYPSGDVRRWTTLHAFLDAFLAIDTPIPPALRARGLFLAAHTVTEPERVHHLLADSLAIYRLIGDRRALLHALIAISCNPDLAPRRGTEAMCREALTLAQELGDNTVIGVILRGLGFAAQAAEDLKGARAFFEESLAVERKRGSQRGVANSRHALAWLALLEGDPGRAREFAEAVKPVYRAVDSFLDLASLNGLLAIAACMKGDYPALYTHFRESVSDPRLHAINSYFSSWLHLLAAALAADGAPERAARLLGAADAFGLGIEDTVMRNFRDLVAQKLAEGRARLGEAAWQAAWEEGHAMTLQEAWSYTLTNTPAAETPV